MISLILVVGCSNQDDNRITVLKKSNSKEMKFIAYKANIDNKMSDKIKSILNDGKWESYQNDKNSLVPDYRIYFNHRDKDTKIVVYSIWEKNKNNLILVKNNDLNNVYRKLIENDSKSLQQIISDIEKN